MGIYCATDRDVTAKLKKGQVALCRYAGQGYRLLDKAPDTGKFRRELSRLPKAERLKHVLIARP